MALPQLRPLVPATLCGNRGHPVSRDVIRPPGPAGTVPAPTRVGTSNVTAPPRLEDVNQMERLASQAAEALAGAPAEDVVRWATDTFGDRICITSSMTDAVIVHLVSQVRPGVDVIFLDTGYHFAETIGTRDAVSAVYPVNVINVTPAQTVAEQDEQMGPRLYSRNPDLCCYLRKVVPLEQALEPYDAWITGVRKEETDARSDTRAVQWDPRREMVKVNPIVDWSQDQVDAYIAGNGVLVNPLVYDGYPSIGCATCTARVEAGADARSGRWAGTGKTECGIHS
jgi:phosphoadenosine phosphosulfate reductase